VSVRLKPDKVVETVVRLRQRIEERFPDSGLYGLCRQLEQIARASEERARAVSQPIAWLRASIGLLLVVLVVGIAVAVRTTPLSMPTGELDLVGLVGLAESAINDLVFVGIVIAFLWTLETRIKRHRALTAIHDLRAIAHIIDMHQLVKDPAHTPGQDTASSPKRQLTSHELRRYLDYCSEMLALTGKIGALYVQDFDDGVVLAAVDEVEGLTTGLSRKIWQKIMVLDARTQAATPR
jgi:fumarate reductase subunit D